MILTRARPFSKIGTGSPKGILGHFYDGLLEHLGAGIRIFSLEYRLSSAAPFPAANPFPAGLIDGLAGYRYLVHDLGYSPRNIIFSGDSAGAGIALSLARYLSTANLPGLPPPAGMVLLSPVGDLARTHTGPRASCVTNRASDLLNSIVESGYSARALLGRIPPEAAARGAWLSPGARDTAPPKGLYARVPPTLVVAGGAEYMLDPMRTLGERMRADMGARCTYLEVPDATHAFVLYKGWHEPERTDALKAIAAWAEGVW